jgi:hypothetical protein
MVSLRNLGMVRGFFMIALTCMLSGFPMVLCCLFVMFGSLFVIFLWHTIAFVE